MAAAPGAAAAAAAAAGPSRRGGGGGGGGGECPVCCAAYTKQQRRPVECLYCAYAACASCVQQYLVSAPRDASCMSCAKTWNRDFLADNLSRAWLHGPFKQHRERVLLEREIALLPASQALVQNYRVARDLERQLKDLEDEHRALQLRLRNNALDAGYTRARLDNVSANNYRGAGGEAVSTERRTFVKACPAEGCRGFLSTAWKCGVCAVYACKDCHEIKGPERDAPHACNPDNVATAALLAKDTKPCPKCAAMIYKIEGCDQMWCTCCNTAFSWRSGLIVTNGQIHNPHYYEFLRRTNGGQAPRNPGDVPCGGLCGYWELTNKLRTLNPAPAPRDTRLLNEFHRSVRHVEGVDIPRLGGHRFNAADHADLRLRYLLNELDQETWQRKLQQREKKRDKQMSMRQVYEMYTTAVAESFRKLIAGAADVAGTINELEIILQFANNSLADIATNFNMSCRTLITVQRLPPPASAYIGGR